RGYNTRLPYARVTHICEKANTQRNAPLRSAHFDRFTTELHLDGATVLQSQRDVRAGRLRPYRGDQRIDRVGRTILDLDDDIPVLQPRLLGGLPGHLNDVSTPTALLSGVADRRTEVGLGGVALLDDLVGRAARLVDRDGETDADVTGPGATGGGTRSRAVDRGVDPDHLAVHVDQGPTGVTRVDRRVRLDRIHHGRELALTAAGAHRDRKSGASRTRRVHAALRRSE